MTIKQILETLEKCNYEIGTEYRLARVGLKEAQEIAPILDKNKWLYEKDTVDFVRSAYDKEGDASHKEELRRLFLELADGYRYRHVAKDADELVTFFAKAEVEVDGVKTRFHDLRAQIPKIQDADQRERSFKAIFPFVEEANPKELEMLQTDIAGIKELGFPDYLAYYSWAKGMDYGKFRDLANALAKDLSPLYESNVKELVARKIGRPWPGPLSCHLSHLLILTDWDRYFPREKLRPAFVSSLADIGIDLNAQPNIHVDAEERPGKNPRAFCSAEKVPEEVHLVIKPIGGFYDYSAFFHEGGHAEHFGNTDAGQPYAFRHLSTSHAYSELFSYLFESLTRNPRWLAHFGIPQADAARIARDAELAELIMLMRYLGKFNYEYEFFKNGNFEQGPELYGRVLSENTGFAYEPLMYLNDMDGGFYSADYLRAWLGRAQLADHLEKNYGKDWFLDVQVGGFLKELWRPGTRFELEEQIERYGIGKPFDTEPLVRKFKESLAK